MRILIFGATGGVGRHLLKGAEEAGHAVTAFTRTPARLGKSHPGLAVREGDVRDPAAVAAAVRGQDAVVCALGMPLRNKEGLRGAGTANIVRGMEAAGVARLVCLSAFGTGESWDLMPGFYKFVMFPLLMTDLFLDHEAQERAVRNSALDWTLVRPVNFANRNPAPGYRHGTGRPERPLKLKVGRAQVADFLLNQLTDTRYLRQAPWLSC